MMVSRRKDGRGHWPKGRARNQAGRRVLPILRAYYHGCRSLRLLAELIGVDQRTVRFWLAGEKYPSPAHAARIVAL